MFNSRDLFISLETWKDPSRTVKLADGKAQAPIHGCGTVQGKTSGGDIFTINNCLYVPNLNYSLLSTKSFAGPSGFSTHTEGYITTITTPKFTFTTDDDLTDTLIYFYLSPANTVTNHVEATPIPSPVTQNPDTLDISEKQNTPLTDEEKEKLLKPPPPQLPKFFKTRAKIMFKRKCDHKFHRGVLIQKSLHKWSITFKPSHRTTTSFDISTTDLKQMYDDKWLMFGHKNLASKQHPDEPDVPDPTASDTDKPALNIPPLQAHDNLVSSLSKEREFTVDQLRRAFGFRNIDSLLPHLRKTSQPTFRISTTDNEPILDAGQVATVDKSRKNTTPLDLPSSFGEVIHLEILYGAGTAHGGVKYALYLVDRATRYKCIYPLKNLGDDILTQMQAFCNDFKISPMKFISDCDQRLFSTQIVTWLKQNDSSINAAPEGKQRQNGLCERSWRTVLRMARGWISSALLPPPFWW